MRPGPSSAKNCRTRHARATGPEPGSPWGVRCGGSGVIADAPESTSARMSGMDRSGVSNRIQLRAIAHRAMVERGLLPDFLPRSRARSRRSGRPRRASPSLRDLRDLLWCSIDNDDSRDLDQLTVAEALRERDGQGPRRDRRRRRAGPAGLGDRRPRAGQHDVGLHRGRDLPDAARAAVDRPHLARPGRGPARRSSSRWWSPPTGRSARPTSTARSSATTRSSPTTASRAWLDGTAPAPPRARGGPGARRAAPPPGPGRAALKALRHERGALSLETLEARAVFDGDADRRPRGRTRRTAPRS